MSHAEPAALAAMAAALAEQAPAGRPSQGLHYGVVRVGGMAVAIAARHLVEAVDRPAEMLGMPQAGALMRGVFMLRGRLIPVVDLSGLLAGSRPPGEGDAARIGQVVVIHDDGASLGIAVDDIGGVLRVTAEQLTALGGEGGLFDEWITGAALGTGPATQALPVLNVAALMKTPGVRPAMSRPGAGGGAGAGAGPAAAAPRHRFTLARVGATVVAFDFSSVPDVSPLLAVKPFFGSSLALRGMVAWRDTELPLVNLAELLGFPQPASLPGASAQSAGKPLQMVLQHGQKRIALQVDALLGLHHAAAADVTPLGSGATLAPACYAGSLRAGEHGIALVLDAEALMAHPLIAAFLESSPALLAGAGDGAAEAARRKNADRCTYLVYQAGGTCATPLADVEEILAYQEGSAVPVDNAGKGMCGLIEQRGRPLELFDLRLLLGRDPAGDPAGQTRVLVVRVDGRQRGFLVDRLVSLISSSEHPAARPGRTSPQAAAPARRQAFGVDRLLMLGSGADAVTCERVDLKSLMPAAQ